MFEKFSKESAVTHLTATSPKDRILQSAIRLFASKGYAATGVRELAENAGVNLAMINYYFGSKSGVLKAVIDEFFTGYRAIVASALQSEKPLEEKIPNLIDSLIGYFRSHTDMMLVTFTEMPIEVSDIATYKAGHISQLIDIFKRNVIPVMEKRYGVFPPGEMIGPAMIGMLVSHFIFRPVLQNLEGVKLNDAFYRQYTRVISEIFLYGILGNHPEKPDKWREVMRRE